MKNHRFEADVRQILDLVTHSLYSEREIFLRELVSNASDALDRARFVGLERDDLRAPEPPTVTKERTVPAEDEDGEDKTVVDTLTLGPGIRVSVDEDAKTITVSDDGIGLTPEEAVEHLGTIAHSGTKAFAKAMADKGTSTEDGLVGQFGVGFYSAFMVAERVEVHSLSAVPDAKPVRWVSDGGEGYELGDGDRTTRGTDVTLHIKEDAAEFLDVFRLRDIVKKHSDYVPWPVYVDEERANQETALWTRDPSEITDDEYAALYKHVSKDWNEPLAHIHLRADAPLQFQAILFIPKTKPWDMDRIDYKPGLKLYQKRVKVLEHAESLLPRYLRFVHGVVDSPDVELNVSREILQQTPVIQAIRKQLVKRVLKELKKVGESNKEGYANFWSQLGYILKEGIHESPKDREKVVDLLRYRTTKSLDADDDVDKLRSLAQVKADMAEVQDEIWYLADVDKERIGDSPLLEAFKKKGYEVVLMDDPVDEWVTMNVREYDEVPLKSVAHGEAPDLDEDDKEDEDPVAKAAREQALPLAEWMGELLGEDVAEVRLSKRLTDSPSILVNQEGAMSANMERILKAANQDVGLGTKRVLEINPEHAMVQTLAKLREDGKDAAEIEPFARLLLDHAHIAEGRLDDPTGFAKRLQALMQKASAGL